MSAWCNCCGKISTVDNSYQYEMLSGKKNRLKKHICRMHAGLAKPIRQQIRYNLAKIHSRPLDSKCMCCGRIDKLHLDHCRNSRKYRCFKCKNCNVGFGHLGDSIEGLERALKYLKKANEQRDNGAVEEAVGG